MAFIQHRTGFWQTIGEKCDELRQAIAQPYPASFAKLEGMPYSQALATEELYTMPQHIRSQYAECIQAKADGLLKKWYEAKTPEAREADRLFVKAVVDAYAARRRELGGVDAKDQAVVVHSIETDPDIVYDRAKTQLDDKEWAFKLDWFKSRSTWLLAALALGGAGYFFYTRQSKPGGDNERD